MHILVTNDDGPPSEQSSPYILPFVQTLEKHGHTVSVILPDTQRSWIGKAHLVGQDVQAIYYHPPSTTPATHDPSSTSNSTSPSFPSTSKTDPWILINSTPAGCAQLGLSGTFFTSRPPIDLVISGPNYGRNTTAVFALSSGTLGAALEAAVCGHRAIALSFAFFRAAPNAGTGSPDASHNAPDVVDEACGHAVRVCEVLAGEERWWNGRSGAVFSVNVPVQRGVSQARTVWTRMLQNEWRRGACFREVEGGEGNKEAEEARIRSEEGKGENGTPKGDVEAVAKDPWRTRHFKWAPRFTDVYDSVEQAGPGSDGWAVKEGWTSVTALRANFMHMDGFEGDVKL